MIILAYFVVAFTIIQLAVAVVNLFFETYLPPALTGNDELVSVLIPARNEEKNIGLLLSDLIKQDYRNIEIIVFNDQSEDRTAEIVTEYTNRDNRIRLIDSGTLPVGWLGKNFACHSLALQAIGKYFLFLDADVRVGADLIGRALSFSKKHSTGLISIFPQQIILSAGERITVPNMNYILLSLLPLVLVRKLKFPSLSAANGQFMFFRSDSYNYVMPHKEMKAEKVEDISIARLYKRKAHKVACLLGDGSLTCRMYAGFSESVNGFSKNVTAFFGNSFILALLFWLVTSFGFLPVLLAMPSIFPAYCGCYLLTRIIISIASRQNIVYNLLFILPLQVSLGFFIFRAFINRNFKKFEWKGRFID